MRRSDAVGGWHAEREPDDVVIRLPRFAPTSPRRHLHGKIAHTAGAAAAWSNHDLDKHPRHGRDEQSSTPAPPSGVTCSVMRVPAST